MFLFLFLTIRSRKRRAGERRGGPGASERTAGVAITKSALPGVVRVVYNLPAWYKNVFDSPPPFYEPPGKAKQRASWRLELAPAHHGKTKTKVLYYRTGVVTRAITSVGANGAARQSSYSTSVHHAARSGGAVATVIR